MPFLPYEARKFTTPLAGPDSGQLSLSLAGLIWGAATMGMTPISMGGMPRPLVELCWRAALAAASLDEEPSSGRWVKTTAYRRLDASEKSAVSYFLGMTQAKITCERLLRAPHLIHLDAYLAAIGAPATRTSRPDLVGVNLPSMNCTIAVEAKGRTWGRTDQIISDAKRQASSMPGVLSTSGAIPVVSVASFDRYSQWEAYLEDPPTPSQPSASLTVETLLAVYYRPLVASPLAAGNSQIAEDDAETSAQLPGIDLTLGIPTRIVTIVRPLPPVGPVPVEQLNEIGARVRDFLSDRLFKSRYGTRQVDEGEDAAPGRPHSYTGLDGVSIGLGPTWQSTAR